MFSPYSYVPTKDLCLIQKPKLAHTKSILPDEKPRIVALATKRNSAIQMLPPPLEVWGTSPRLRVSDGRYGSLRLAFAKSPTAMCLGFSPLELIGRIMFRFAVLRILYTYSLKVSGVQPLIYAGSQAASATSTMTQQRESCVRFIRLRHGIRRRAAISLSLRANFGRMHL